MVGSFSWMTNLPLISEGMYFCTNYVARVVLCGALEMLTTIMLPFGHLSHGRVFYFYLEHHDTSESNNVFQSDVLQVSPDQETFRSI